MIKKLARLCVTAGCRGLGMLAREENVAVGQLLILCYHRILPADRKAAYFIPDLAVTPEAFHDHCRILRQRCRVLPLSEAVDTWSKDGESSAPLAVITFDDGYQDNYRFAGPILADTDLRATFFIISDLIGSARRPWYDVVGDSLRHSEARTQTSEWMRQHQVTLQSEDIGSAAQEVVTLAKRLGPHARQALLDRLTPLDSNAALRTDDRIMTAEQLRNLQTAGHEIGSHSRTHELLPQLDDDALDAEVTGSRQQIEAIVGRPVRSFCYPNGDTTDQVAQAVMAAGYKCAVTTEPGVNRAGQDLHRLKRWFIHEERLAGLLGTTSEGLMRMELVGLSDRLFGRDRRRLAQI